MVDIWHNTPEIGSLFLFVEIHLHRTGTEGENNVLSLKTLRLLTLAEILAETKLTSETENICVFLQKPW